MTGSDAYVLPIDHDVVAARRRLFVIITGGQVAVVVIATVLIGVLFRSWTAALFAVLILGIVLALTLRTDTARWRNVRAITQYPPVFAADGLRLRVVTTSGYDLLVPWSRVTRIDATARGQRWNLVVHIDDTGGLAGDDPVKQAALRKMQGPPGAGLRYRIGYVAADLNELDEVVRRHSDGRLSVEITG